MSKETVVRVILIATAVLLLLGIILFIAVIFNDKDTSVIKVKLEKGENETIAFENLALLPGEQCEYNVELTVGSAKKYDLTLDFNETREGELKKYACAKISVSGEVIFDDLFTKLFEKRSFSLPIDLSEQDSTRINLLYYLPETVGNEAQDTAADFTLVINAGNK